MKANGWHDRVASALIALASILWGALSFADWLRDRQQPPISDIEAYSLFSKVRLERRLGLYQSPWRWLPLLVPASMCVGFVTTFEDGGGWGHIFSIFVIGFAGLVIWMLCLDTPAKIEGRLARLNERIAEGSAGGVR
jgi:hypothetical protein